MTLIQIRPDGNRSAEVIREGNLFRCGEWMIEAELNARKPASLYIRNTTNQAVFSFGKKETEINGKVYRPHTPSASVLYDQMDGNWKIQEAEDYPLQLTGGK